MFIVLDQTMFEIEAFSWCCRRRLTLLWYRALCRQTLSALYSCSFWCFGASTAHRTGRAAAPVVEEQGLPSVLLGEFFLKIIHIYLRKKKKYGKTQVSCSYPDYKKRRSHRGSYWVTWIWMEWVKLHWRSLLFILSVNKTARKVLNEFW